MHDALHRWLDPLALQQDYAWFLAAAAWLTVLVAALRPGGDGARKPWLAVMAALQAAGALVALAHFITEPGHTIDTHRFWDWAAWTAMAGQVAALAWPLGRRAAWPVVLLAAGLGGWQATRPRVLGRGEPEVWAGLAFALLAAAVAWAAVRGRGRPWAGLSLAVMLGAAVSPHGALAEMVHEARRWSELSLLALPAAAASLAGAVFARAVAEGTSVRAAWWEPERRRLHLRLAAWLAGGLLLAVVSGATARRSFEGSLLARAQAFALAADTPTLETWLRDELRLGARRFGRTFARRPIETLEAPAIDSPAIQPLRQYLARIHGLSADLRYAHISILRDDAVVIALMRRVENDPRGRVIRYADATAADRAAWAAKTPHVLPPASGPRGPLVQARAPLLGREGAMLGWLTLDVSVSRWASVQAQARLQVLAAVALGIGLLLLAERHRRRTDEKEAAEQAAAIARAAEQAKGAFLAQVSHELRTPIQSVLGYGELLQGTPLAPAQRRWVEAQQAHGELLLRLVNDLLDTLSLQAGRFRLDPRPGEVAVVVAQVVDSLRVRAEAKGLALGFTPPQPPAGRHAFDAARVRQVVLNLLGNAIKFTPHGRIDVTLAVAPAAGGVACCTLSVRDSGPGIPPDQQGKLFQPFVRLPGSEKHEGTGLGLALSRRLCRAMNGDLMVVSDGRNGSTFVAIWNLPVAAAAEAGGGAAAETAPAPALGGLRVLVADDNALVRELFAEALRRQGARVEIASDGAEALAKAEPGVFDAIVLDLSMPEMEGDEAARRIRERDRTVRLVGVSAHADARDHARAIAAGMDGFLPKPVSLAALFAFLRPGTEPVSAGETADLQPLWERMHRDFTEGCPGVAANLDRAWQRRDWRALARLAHHLKGSADLLGFRELAAACAALYAAAETRSESAGAEAFRSVQAAVEGVAAAPLRPAS